MPVYFLIRDIKGLDMYKRRGGKELVEVEEGNTIIRIYYMSNDFIFNKRGKRQKITKLFHESLGKICILYLTFDWH